MIQKFSFFTNGDANNPTDETKSIIGLLTKNIIIKLQKLVVRNNVKLSGDFKDVNYAM